MRNYLIIVEGAHDIAVIQKLLRINGVDKIVHSERELPPVWRRTIPWGSAGENLSNSKFRKK